MEAYESLIDTDKIPHRDEKIYGSVPLSIRQWRHRGYRILLKCFDRTHYVSWREMRFPTRSAICEEQSLRDRFRLWA